MNGYSAIPASYQNGLYWQYFMKSFEDAMAMQQKKANAYQDSIMANQASGPLKATNQSYVNNADVEAANAAQAQAAMQTQSVSTPVLKEVKDGKVYVVADGKDDGKISGAQKFANFAKGAGNFFKGMFCGKDGKFSLLQTAKTVGLVALGFAVPAIGIGMLAVGGAMSAYSLGKGIVKANAAKTDAEAETAWQNIGEGTTGVVMTAVGAKALKTSKAATAAEALRYKGIKGYGRAVKDVYVDAGKGIKKGYTHVKENGIKSSLRTAKDVSKDYITSSWEGRFRSTNAKNNAKSRMEAAYDKQVLKHETRILELEQKIANSKNAKKSAEWRAEITELRGQIADIIKAKSEIPETPSTAFSKTRIKNINKNINEKNAEIAQIRKDNPTIDSLIQQRADLKRNYPAEVARFDNNNPQVAKLLKLEKDVNTLKNLKQRVQSNPDINGYRQNQIDYYTKLEAYAKAQAKKSKGAEKTKWESIQKQAGQRVAEHKQFRYIEQAQENALRANKEIARVKDLLKKVEDEIKVTKDAEKLTDLNIKKAKYEAEISANKMQIQTAKNQLRHGYKFENITSYIKENHKPIGYPTMAVASRDIEEVATYDPQDIQAMMYGFSSAAEMEAALKAEGSQGAQEALMAAQEYAAANTQAQAKTTAKSTAQTTSNVTNPYTQYSLYSQMNMTPPMGTGLEFQDVYKSPYAGLI